MKKILSLVLVAIMMMAMSVTAFAEEITENNGTTSINIYGQIDSDGDGIVDSEDTTDDSEVIAVDITWAEITFIYKTEWNTSSLSYSSYFYSTSDKTIKVENRSNVDITCKFNSANVDYAVTESSVYDEETGEYTDTMVQEIHWAEWDAETDTLTIYSADSQYNGEEITRDDESGYPVTCPYGSITVDITDAYEANFDITQYGSETFDIDTITLTISKLN